MAVRWKRGDYIALGKAIAQFNKTIKKLEKEEKNLSLPEMQDYQTQRNRIVTRNELNRYIKSLKRFQRETQQQQILLESGEKISKWQYSEIKKARKRITRNIEKELETLNEPQEFGYSRAEMGSQRVRSLEAQLRSLHKFEGRTGYDLREQMSSILRRGRLDYIEYKQEIYKENFLTMLEEFKNYKGYEEFKNFIDKLSPKKFYDFISNDEDLIELQYWYDTKSGKVVPRGLSSEEHFIGLLNRLGINIE